MPITIPKNLIKYSSFILACFLVVWIFVTATTFIQLAIGVIVYPLLVLFAYKIFSHRMRIYPSKRPANIISPSVRLAEKAEQSEKSSIGIADIDKRVFLKLIGGTGLTLFLFSLFSKKTEGLFPRNVPVREQVVLSDGMGKKIIPSQSQPLDGYNIAEVENDIISFYGFIDKNGVWYVLRVDMVAGSFRYARGTDNFPSAWENRETLEYGYFNDVFRAK